MTDKISLNSRFARQAAALSKTNASFPPAGFLQVSFPYVQGPEVRAYNSVEDRVSAEGFQRLCDRKIVGVSMSDDHQNCLVLPLEQAAFEDPESFPNPRVMYILSVTLEPDGKSSLLSMVPMPGVVFPRPSNDWQKYRI